MVKLFQVYPYELFQTVHAMRQCVKFPDYKAFSTSIKGDVDIEVYRKNKAEFDTGAEIEAVVV